MVTNGNRILVVDDDLQITKEIKYGLEQNGFAVDAFEDPITARNGFSPHVYDVAIIDIRMPKMNGFELYHEIRKTDSNARILFLTAFEINNEEFRKMFPRMNVSAFVRKPVNMNDLLRLIVEPEADRTS